MSKKPGRRTEWLSLVVGIFVWFLYQGNGGLI